MIGNNHVVCIDLNYGVNGVSDHINISTRSESRFM